MICPHISMQFVIAKNMKTIYALLFILLGSFSLSAQQTLKLNDQKSPPAKLSEVAWLAGNWVGKAFGGETQEFWAPPLGDSMMGAFKLVNNGKVEFYELCQIREENGSLILRLKHFHGDLKGWEKQDDTVEFPLVKMEENAAYFEDFTIRKISPNEIRMYVLIGAKGEESEVEFKYFRSNSN